MSDLFPSVPPGLPPDYAKRYEQLQRELHDVQQRITEVEETAYSADRTVAATVGAHGELKVLQLDPRIYRTTDAKALAATITKTVRDAAEAVSAQLVELTRPLISGASSTQINELFNPYAAQGDAR